MTTRPRFSIAMATYNGERFLLEQLESLNRQTLIPYELVVGDDGSADSTLDILHEFSTRASFTVKIFKNDQTLGYGANFLKAAHLCRGEWVAFCDQDDVWLESKLNIYEQVLRRHPNVDLISHSAKQFNSNLKPLGAYYVRHKGFSITGPLENKPFGALPGFTCCVRKSLLDKIPADNRPRDPKRPGHLQPHDAFIYNIVNTYGHIARHPQSLVLYRRHRHTVTGEIGTGVQKADWLKRRSYARAEGYVAMADLAEQHRRFYVSILEGDGKRKLSSQLRSRTVDAVRFYAIAHSYFAARARLYVPQSSFRFRLGALFDTYRQGLYREACATLNFGRGPLLKDLTRVFLSWG